MRFGLSCTAALEVPKQETLPYIHFSDEACSKS
jgi:hypothetical protein